MDCTASPMECTQEQERKKEEDRDQIKMEKQECPLRTDTEGEVCP